MLRRTFAVAVFLACSLALSAQEPGPVKLPSPRLDSGKTLLYALQNRQSSRSFSAERLPVEVMSRLLWAACGVNRPVSGKRTAPSAKNWQEIDVYVATRDGLYLYDAKGHALRPIVMQDLRPLTGTQPFVREAPVSLVYVADFSKTRGAGPEEQALYSAADTGFISQNVYLFCASEGLATVVRGSMDRDALGKAMKLSGSQRIILAQTVGYPKE